MSDSTTGDRQATLTSVARAAGVSLPTVSKVVNGRADVSEATRAKIERLLQEHNYVGRTYGRSRPSQPSLSLVFDTFENPYSMEIARGVMEAGAQDGAAVCMTLTSVITPGQTWAERVVEARPDGLILVTSELSEGQRRHFAKAQIPLVVIDPINLPTPEVTSIGATNWAGAMAATQHLLELGHRRIAAIIGRPETTFGGARLHGYRAAIADAGIADDPALVRTGPFRYEPSYRHALELLALTDRPTAVFASSDVQALGVLAAARRLDIRVPEQLSVVSFDDTVVAQWAAPPLTAVHQPFAEMGRAATQVVLQMLAGREPASHRIELATSLVVRESTAPRPSSLE